jgi:hypothetical protein
MSQAVPIIDLATATNVTPTVRKIAYAAEITLTLIPLTNNVTGARSAARTIDIIQILLESKPSLT